MNTPPTMSVAPLPKAPIKSSRKEFSKLDIKPKKLLYNDPDFEMDPNELIKEQSVEMQEKLKITETKSSRSNFVKHIEQNELDNEAEETKIDYSYNLRRRNKNTILQNATQGTKKKVTQKKTMDKENIQLENPSTSAYNPSNTQLSEPNKSLSAKEKVIWLQSKRDVGIWVQCCDVNCQKWRYLEEVHEPTKIPEFWICAMNSDQRFTSCKVLQDLTYYEVKGDLIENKFNAGSLVWGKVNDYPWWPAIVDDCPDVLRYYELKGSSKTPIKYHCTFLEENVKRAWLVPNRIKRLNASDTKQPAKRPKIVYQGKNFAEELNKYLELAKAAIPLSITERLQKYSFVSRYTGENSTQVPKRRAPKRKPPRIGIMKSSKRRKTITKFNKVYSAEAGDQDTSGISCLDTPSQLELPSSSNTPLATSSKPKFAPSSDPMFLTALKSLFSDTSNVLASSSKPEFSTLQDLKIGSVSNEELSSLSDVLSTATLKPEFSSSSKSQFPTSSKSLATFSKPESYTSSDPKIATSLKEFSTSTDAHSKPEFPTSSDTSFFASSRPEFSSSSEPPVINSSKYNGFSSSDPTYLTSLKKDFSSASKPTSHVPLKQNAFDKWKSIFSTPDKSDLSDFEPSLPVQSASEYFSEEFLKSQQETSKKSEDLFNDSFESISSSIFGLGPSSDLLDRYFNEFIENVQNFDPDNLDELNLDELKQRYGYDKYKELFSDSEEEEENKWFYRLESDTENKPGNGNCSDSSEDDYRPGTPAHISKTFLESENKSKKVVLRRIDNFKEYLDGAVKKLEKNREIS